MVSNVVLHSKDGVKDNNRWLNQVSDILMETIDEPSWNAIPPSMMLAPWCCVKVSSVKYWDG